MDEIESGCRQGEDNSTCHSLSPTPDTTTAVATVDTTTSSSSSTHRSRLYRRRMTQSERIKVRLGPVMERMHKSLATMQKIESSIEERRQRQAQSEATAESTPDVVPDSISSGDVPAKSKVLLKHAVERLQDRLQSIQDLEDLINEHEDRRQDLQHHFLQASLSGHVSSPTTSRKGDTSAELARVKQRNRELEEQLAACQAELNQQRALNVRLQAKPPVQIPTSIGASDTESTTQSTSSRNGEDYEDDFLDTQDSSERSDDDDLLDRTHEEEISITSSSKPVISLTDQMRQQRYIAKLEQQVQQHQQQNNNGNGTTRRSAGLLRNFFARTQPVQQMNKAQAISQGLASVGSNDQ